jgi:hypothetical protein
MSEKERWILDKAAEWMMGLRADCPWMTAAELASKAIGLARAVADEVRWGPELDCTTLNSNPAPIDPANWSSGNATP